MGIEVPEWVDNFITRDTILGHPLDDVFSFRTNKVVRIQDRVLGGIDLAIRIAIWLFVFFFLIQAKRSYTAMEPVSGTALWALTGSFVGVNKTALEYCKGTRCRFVDEASVKGSGDLMKAGQLFVATMISEREQKLVCEDNVEVCARKSAFKTEKVDEFYAAGVDEYVAELSFEVFAPTFFALSPPPQKRQFHGTSDDMTGKLVSFRDDGTGRVRTVDLKEFKPREGIRFSLAELLDAAGLDLDKPIPKPPLEKEESGFLNFLKTEETAAPAAVDEAKIREAGVLIDCHIRYNNDWSTWSPAPAIKYEMEFTAAAIQRPSFSSSTQVVGFGDARMQVNRKGVYIRVLHEGQLGQFSYVYLLMSLSIGFMLTSLASWIVGYVATRYLPLSERYETHKYEYTENIYNLRASRAEFNDRVIEPQISVQEQIKLAAHTPLKDNSTDMKNFGSIKPSK